MSPSIPRRPVGFIGLGAMGAPMARRLATLGHRVLVHDLNAAAMEKAVQAGAMAATVPEIAAQADLVMTCLPSLEALEAVLLGPKGLAGGSAVRTIVDFSTTGVEFARATAQALRQRGIELLDAPITGNVGKAGDGSLGIMCSGPRTAYERAEPLMRDLASAIVLYLGEQNGRAQKLKLLNNLLSATGMAVSCEAFILGAKWGLDPDVMLGVINAGEASSSASRNKFPTSVLPRRFDFGARMAITAKDIALNVAEGEDAGVPMWIGDAARQIWHYAVSQGGAEKDGSSLITFLEPWAGVEVRGTGKVPAGPELPPVREAGLQYLIVCDLEAQPALAERLGASIGGQRQLLALSAGSDADALLRALPADRAGPRLVLNFCPMPSACSQRLADALGARGDAYLDAALTTSAAPGAEVPHLVLASGAVPAFAAARPVLQAFGPCVVHASEKPGGAHLLQMIEACVASTLLAVTCEAYVVGAKSGLEPLTMRRILGIETGRNAASERIVPEQVATRKFAHGKRLGDACREFALLAQEAHGLGVSCWVLEKAGVLYRLAASLGSPNDDITRLATRYEHWAGVQVRSGALAD